ncbi:class I SAM-dependent methyltransferase [Pedobacter sp. HDW13]|uniref:SAM-dependent methyltransferase n=1 Tax=unclassified Pedobacter TaxID=2628915 RepID=UPI000F5A004B|nr:MULTISPECIES: cyclopropane-fatty-acyl-phospholipid synthase family protein [unclassified Pedobacter]QIL40318.1 class I SAM-dependent methyltransferase [Pedobacter sp. HDW13]RQO79406.1 cyclopropane-fatty-acyl-phospholipid synthase [Pedobacter sp. KBW01]
MNTLVATRTSTGFFEKVVLNALSKMTLGKLELSMPNGEILVFGNGEHKIEANIQVNHPDFFKSIALYGDIGFGEAYTDGLWDTTNITNVIKWVILNIENAPSITGSKVKSFALGLLKWVNKIYHVKRANTLAGSRKNISEHYDLNNDFFATFLDKTMTYSSGYFLNENTTLEESQYAKYDRLAKQLKIKATDHVLEIGSGWGGNAIFLAKKYGCKVTSVTISKEQQKLAQERVYAEKLEDRVSVIIQDYRKITGTFDKIVSIEMLEAVGHQYLEAYFEKCQELLKPDGIFAFQVITSPDSRYDKLRTGVDWIQKHIFPGSLLPSVAAMNKAINETGDLTLVDLKDMGLDYARTLHLWFIEFNKNLDKVKTLGFGETFIRKWNYYLNYCEAAFAMRNINVMQMVYSRPNNTGR